MFSVTWRKALVAPAALALAFGGALFTAGAAHADTVAFAVTTPAAGSTYDNSAHADQVTFTGVGLPTGDTIGVTYYQGTKPGPIETATVTAPVSINGTWSINATMPDSGPGTTGADVIVTALKNGVADPADASQEVAFGTTVPLVPADFAVTNPAVGDTQDDSVVTFSGTGVTNVQVGVGFTGAGDEPEGFGTTADSAGNWSVAVDFSKLPVGATSAQVTVTEYGANAQPFPGTTPITLTVTFATAPNVGTPTATVIPIVTTLDKATSTGVQVDGSDFAPGEPVTITVTDVSTGDTVDVTQDDAAPAADQGGSFGEKIIFPTDTTGYAFEVTVTGTTSHLTATAPVALIGDPTITAPTEGQALVGSTVTFSGTGTPGSNIVVVYGPTAEIKAQLQKSMQAMTRAQAKSTVMPKAATPAASSPTDPADPTTPIVVGDDGTWSVTYTAKPGAYTVLAVGTLLDDQGDILLDQDGDPIVTSASDPVDFTLTAAAAAVTAAGGTTGTLAFTGSDSGPAAITGGLLLLVGLGLTVVARRRRVAGERD